MNDQASKYLLDIISFREEKSHISKNHMLLKVDKIVSRGEIRFTRYAWRTLKIFPSLSHNSRLYSFQNHMTDHQLTLCEAPLSRYNLEYVLYKIAIAWLYTCFKMVVFLGCVGSYCHEHNEEHSPTHVLAAMYNAYIL